MSEEGFYSPKYGDMDKLVSFKDSKRRYEELQTRLKVEGISVSKFFRALVTLYLENDVRMMDVMDHLKVLYTKEPKQWRNDTRNLINEGKTQASRFALDDDTIDNIFDILEHEKPDL
jgi:hypothetical protein